MVYPQIFGRVFTILLTDLIIIVWDHTKKYTWIMKFNVNMKIMSPWTVVSVLDLYSKLENQYLYSLFACDVTAAY